MLTEVKAEFHPVLNREQLLIEKVVNNPDECLAEVSAGEFVKNLRVQEQSLNELQVTSLRLPKNLSEVQVLGGQLTEVQRTVTVDCHLVSEVLEVLDC